MGMWELASLLFKKLPSPSRVWVITVFVAGLFVAQFLVYRDVSKELADHTPRITGEIYNYVFFDNQPENQSTNVFVMVKLANDGAPSVVSQWNVVGRLADQDKTKQARLLHFMNPPILKYPDGIEMVLPKITIRDKTETERLERGGQVYGGLLLQFEYPYSEIEKRGLFVEVLCSDYLDNKISISDVLKPRKNPLLFEPPGMPELIVRFSKQISNLSNETLRENTLALVKELRDLLETYETTVNSLQQQFFDEVITSDDLKKLQNGAQLALWRRFENEYRATALNYSDELRRRIPMELGKGVVSPAMMLGVMAPVAPQSSVQITFLVDELDRLAQLLP